MSRTTVRLPRPRRGVTGNALWKVSGKGQFYWNGPGSRLKFLFGDQLVQIDHPSADGSYRTLREATAALRRFIRAFPPRERAHPGVR